MMLLRCGNAASNWFSPRPRVRAATNLGPLLHTAATLLLNERGAKLDEGVDAFLRISNRPTLAIDF
jgi:hypothetical protein